jgi:predicted O-methyltransferase YrrM
VSASGEAVIGRIEGLVDGVPGWTPLDQLYSLFLLAVTTEAEGDILEVGSWCGRSTLALALAAREIGGVTVHSVDLFPEKEDWSRNADGSRSLHVKIGNRVIGAYEHQTVWAEPFERDIAPIYARYNGIQEVFNETMTQRGFANIVRAWKGDLAHFAELLPQKPRCRLVFLDGDHGYHAVCRDIELAGDYLAPGGWICFDDAFSSYEGVDRAIREKVLAGPLFENRMQLTRKFFVARKR